MDEPGHASRSVPLKRAGSRSTEWLVRLAVAAVLAVNLDCAFSFIVRPDRYAGGFELTGIPGEVAVRGLGIAFLMWNATYPLVVWQPRRYRTLFGVVLAQQAIGLIGESWLLLTIPAGHEALAGSITRFIAFDGVGLVLMLGAYVLLRAATPPPRHGEHT